MDKDTGKGMGIIMRKIVLKMAFLNVCISVLLSGCGKSAKEDVTEEKEIEGISALSTERPSLTAEQEKTEEEEIEEVTTEAALQQEILTDLENQLEELVSAERDKGARVSVYVEKLSDGAFASLSDGQMPSASLIKLFVAGCVYEQKEELAAAGQSEGELEELVQKMITVSDNDATNTLVKLLGNGSADSGMEKINAYCYQHGFDATSIGRLMLDDTSEKDNYTSVTDCARFLKLVYQGRIVGFDAILGYMKQQQRRNKIPAAIPYGVETANKTGELNHVENDVAIVYAEGEPYILCVMMSELPDIQAGRDAIVDISSRVYAYMNHEM